MTSSTEIAGTQVACAQLRYTWAERRLEGTGGGFGVVLRSADWPTDLLADPAMRELLTNIDADLRAESPETAPVQVAHLRWQQGSLLVAKRPVGQDGAGRPGNYAVHALYDASGTLGSLDLAPLVAGGSFVLERDVDIQPSDEAPPVSVWAPPDWRSNGARVAAGSRSGAARTYGDRPLLYRDPASVAELLGELCVRLPADLVNQLEISRGRPGAVLAGRPAGEVDRVVGAFDEAVSLGIVEREAWWSRRGESVDAWLVQARGFVTMNQPVKKVPDTQLWTRWDHASVRGRVIVAQEVIARGSRIRTAEAVTEVRARPELLDEMLEAGLKGGSAHRVAAADWVAAVGDDARVIDIAAELHHLGDDQALSRALLDRLQKLPPNQLRPPSLAGHVATQLDGSAALAPEWRAHCLHLRLAGQLTCSHPEDLITSSSERDLSDAVLAVRAGGVSLETCWANLAPLDWSGRSKALLSCGPEAADFLLRRDLPASSEQSSAEVVEMWPQIARAAGWSTWARRLPTDLELRIRQLRAQRLVLLIALGVLVIVAVIFALV